MLKLIKNEFVKFSNSYINIVAFAAMIFPVVFTSLIYRFTDSFTVNWSNYINSLHLFYGIFLGALIPSFVAIFAVYYELKSGTIKNLITSPYSRVKIIAAKILYVMIFVALLYVAVGILVYLSGALAGLSMSFADALNVMKMVSVTGMTTIVLVPMMIYFTLVFKNFVVPVVITFLGTVIGIPIINLGQSYYYPWMIPSNFFFRFGNPGEADFTMPVICFAAFVALFFLISVVRFRRMDFDD